MAVTITSETSATSAAASGDSAVVGIIPTVVPAPMSSTEMTRRLAELEHTAAGVRGSEASYARRATFVASDRRPWGLLWTATALLVLTVGELFVAVLVFS